ncbi:hypothetical protein E6R60_33080 [Streptomyces sp. A0642]|uniref:hypothetical protein n=1 Tax=Streptomyces sp. A0642 TaxID=2563100 RepID=UPI0010A29259|nr:hypothetical protein [Streptomyces sp. A0642]THA65354.1 hypothetical protein E6R60_33080 [Streptomyces sp. A0642]
MTAQLSATWVRVADQWVRADQVVAVRLEPPAGIVPGGRWSESVNQRLLVCTTLPAEEESGKAVWQEAAVCAKGRGEIVAGTLMDAMHTDKAAGSTRYVYPARSTEGTVLHWQASTTLPQGPALTGPAPHGAPAITGGIAMAARGA